MKSFITNAISFGVIALTGAALFTACVTDPAAKYHNASWAGLNNRRPTSTDYISEIQNAKAKPFEKVFEDVLVKDVDGNDWPSAKARADKIFHFARTDANNFFAYLRTNRPIFSLQGAPGVLKIKNKDVSIPNIYVVTQYADVDEVLKNNQVFTVQPYQPIMDATVGYPFMLGYDGDYELHNQEKPAMREALYKRYQYDRAAQKWGYHPGNNLEKVRAVVASLAKRAIASGFKDGKIDVVKSVSRAVPLGLNDEYFGFNPPDAESMARWSRATQYAFFHNPNKDEKVEKNSVKAGEEMREYISNVLIPDKKLQITNGRPMSDTVSQLVAAAPFHHHAIDPDCQPNDTRDKCKNDDRFVANIIGLLVGSVETTSAAITQSLQYIMDNPDVYAQAMAAIQARDDQKFSRIVWEALRFDPVNPWVARIAQKDQVIGESSGHPVTIPAGSLVLASTQSAMWDESVFPDPETFSIDPAKRDTSKYMHLGWLYHRCLGDDVAMIMVPETVKQIMMINGLRKISGSKIQHDEEQPFPEGYVLGGDSYTQGGDEGLSSGSKDPKAILAELGLGTFIAERILQSEKRNEIIKTLEHLQFGNTQQKRQAIYDVPLLVDDAMKNFTADQKIDACMNKNPKSKEGFKDPDLRRRYCSIRMDYRACYITERIFNKQSAYASYYHCAYGRNFLTPAERKSFKANFAGMDSFYFLNYEGTDVAKDGN